MSTTAAGSVVDPSDPKLSTWFEYRSSLARST
jgi:hypothetical protein